MSETQLATKSPVRFGLHGVEITTLEDAFRFATAVSKSGFAPKGIDSPESIMIAIQFGAELGLTPMASLQSLAIVNGRPAVYGDAALALVRASGELESYIQAIVGEGDNAKAIVKVKRKGYDATVSEFSVADAKKAQLWGKQGPWSQFPTRMLMWRARGFALRDSFGDVLRGLRTVEEAGDIPKEIDVTPKASFTEALNAPVELPETRQAASAPADPADDIPFNDPAPKTPMERLLVKAAEYGADTMDGQIDALKKAEKKWGSPFYVAKKFADLADGDKEFLLRSFDLLMEGGK